MKRRFPLDPFETGQLGCTNRPPGLLFIGETLLRHGFDVRPDNAMTVNREAAVALHDEIVHRA